MTIARVVATAVAGLALLCSVMLPDATRAASPAGVFDLRGWDVQQEPVRMLHGDWLVRWEGQGDAEPFQVPGGWRGREIGGERRGKFGRADLHARVLLPGDQRALALHLGYIKSAFRIHVNGEEIGGRGVPGDRAASEDPDLRPLLVPLPDTDVVDIRIELSNHFHSDGGADRFVRIGKHDTLQQQIDRKRMRTLLMLAALAGLAVYIATLSLWQGSVVGSGLFVCLLLLCMARIAAVTGVLDGLEVVSTALRFRIDYASAFAVPAVYVLLLRTLFPREYPRPFTQVVVAGSLLLLASLLLPVSWFTMLRDVTALFVVSTGIVALFFLTKAVRNRRFGARLVFLGGAVFALAIFNDALVAVRMLDTGNLTAFGAMFFLLAHGVAVGGRVFDALKENRRLSASLRALNESLEGEVEVRTRELRQAHRDARRDARHKTRLLNVLSHEIRTPLQGILGHTELLRRRVSDDDAARRLAIISETGEALERLVEDMLALGYLEGDPAQPRRDVLAPRELVDHVLAVVQPRAVGKGLQLVGSVADEVPRWLVGDMIKLRQILLNLLDNAVRITEAGTIEVVMACSSRSGHYQIRVCDEGPGLGRERARRFFREFEHDDNSPGVGLGLFIVSRLVQFLGGSIEVEGASGRGTCFLLELPLAMPEDSRQTTGASLTPGKKMQRILLVEDDPANRALIAELLAAEGHDVTVAAGEEEAFLRAGEGIFDLVLVDYRLDGLSGIELCERLRSRLGTRDAIHLLLTAETRAGSRLDPWSAGIDGVLAKPLKLEDLYRAVALCGEAYGTGPDSPCDRDFAIRVKELQETLGAPVVDGLLRTLSESLEAAGVELARARERGDWTTCREVGHRVAGSAANYGLHGLEAAAGAVRVTSEAQLATVLRELEAALVAAREAVGGVLE